MAREKRETSCDVKFGTSIKYSRWLQHRSYPNLYLSYIGNALCVGLIIKHLAYFIFLIQANPDYDDSVCHAFVHDICEETASFPFPPQSLDVILAVFVLSAIHPDRQVKVNNTKQLMSHLRFPFYNPCNPPTPSLVKLLYV